MNKKKFFRNKLFRQTLIRNVERIKRQEHFSSEEADMSWKNVERLLSGSATPQSISERTFFRRRLLPIGTVAASLLLIISASLWQIHAPLLATSTKEAISIQHIHVPNGKSLEILLPDGSKVYANAGSHISYPSVFNKDRREINVVGEAYLEVTHNARLPFVVKANGFEVRVLGTKFNISAYPGAQSASVVLVQGSVQIETEKKENTLLHPNELADITPQGTCTRRVDVSKYISWKDHFILLDEEKLETVSRKLSTYYGTDIHCDAEVAGLPLSGKLGLDNSLEEVIGILHKTTKLDCIKDGNGYRLYKRNHSRKQKKEN